MITVTADDVRTATESEQGVIATFFGLHVWAGPAVEIPDEPGYEVLADSAAISALMRKHGNDADAVAVALTPAQPVEYEPSVDDLA